MEATSDTNWPAWISALAVVLSSIAGAIVGAVVTALRVSSRLDRMDARAAEIGKDLGARLDKTIVEISLLIDQKITQDRHEHVYPTLQRQVIAPLDKLEEEVKNQGQNIAILLDRNKIETTIKEAIADLAGVMRRD